MALSERGDGEGERGGRRSEGLALTFPATARNWTCVMRVRLPLPVEEVAEPEPTPPATEVLTDALTEAVTEAATEKKKNGSTCRDQPQ